MNLISPLSSYVRDNQLGRIYAPDTGFRVEEKVFAYLESGTQLV